MNMDVWVVGTSIHLIIKVLILKQNFEKSKVNTGKIPFIGIGQF